MKRVRKIVVTIRVPVVRPVRLLYVPMSAVKRVGVDTPKNGRTVNRIAVSKMVSRILQGICLSHSSTFLFQNITLKKYEGVRPAYLFNLYFNAIN